jgi:hypothetical protein
MKLMVCFNDNYLSDRRLPGDGFPGSYLMTTGRLARVVAYANLLGKQSPSDALEECVFKPIMPVPCASSAPQCGASLRCNATMPDDPDDSAVN